MSLPRKSDLQPSVENALTGYNRPDIERNRKRSAETFAWRKGWRDAQSKIECPHCHVVGDTCAHLCWPGSFHCHSCHGPGWFQADLVVSPAMVLNPEAEGAAA